MRRIELLLLAAVAAACLTGCASDELAVAPERPDRPWSPPVDDGVIVSAPPSPKAQPDGYVLPANPSLAVVRSPPALEGGHVYTLAELIDLAESHNPQTRIAWDEAKDAALAAGIARSAFLPNLTASVIGGYQTGHEDHTVGTNLEVGQSTLDGSISSVNLKWLLFDFGARAAMLDMAKQASIISNVGFTAAHQALIYRVSLAFYADAAARAKAATADQALKDAQAVEAAADGRYRAGEGTVVETAQAVQATAQAEFAKIRADGGAEDARQGLINAMGLPPTTRINVEDIGSRNITADAAAPIDQLVASAISRRPDVLSAYAAQEASFANVRAARAEFMPKVFISASGAYTSHDLSIPAVPGFGGEGSYLNLNGDKFGGTVLLGITMPLFDGGIRDARLKQAHNDADRAATQLDQVRDQAAREVITAGADVKTSVAAYHAAQALTRASQMSFDSALGAYRHGVGSITDVTVAESKLLDARNLETDSYSAALAAAASLALSAGALGGAPID
jgi:outer membrane protein